MQKLTMNKRVSIVAAVLIAAAALVLLPLVSAVGEQKSLDYAQVVQVRAMEQAEGRWRFDVTVRHHDEGWDHYADAWQVTDVPGENIYGERVLAHPHDTEQPFTRSLSGIVIPPEVDRVRVRAKCNLHGFGSREITVDLNRSKGEGFEVRRLEK
jgi:hypothetical protein